jgi:membrane fusion protein, multidrug efflux system
VRIKVPNFKILVGVLPVFAAALVLAGCGKKQQAMNPMAMMMMEAAPVRAVAAVAKDVPLDVSAVGSVEALSTVDVKSRIAGEVLRVYFQEGQFVEKGQKLFEIDPEPTQRQLAEIEADIQKDIALEQQAKANVIKDKAQIQQTQASADRALALAKDGIFSKEQTEQSVATNDAALASLKADEAAVESAAASLTADRARLAQTQLQLQYTNITAPISGRAGAISVKPGNLIKDNDAALVTILQISPIEVSFGVPQQLLPEVQRYNAEAPLLVQAATVDGKTVSGHLKFIDNTVDTTTGAIKLKAEFPNADRVLWPGQYVNVQARLSLQKNMVVVPSSTVETGPQGKYVWIMNSANNTVTMRPVNVLRNYKAPQAVVEEAVIGSGLQPGEMVITEGQMRLMPGAKVRVLNNQSTQAGDNGANRADS